jgi:hypothetical protein
MQIGVHSKLDLLAPPIGASGMRLFTVLIRANGMNVLAVPISAQSDTPLVVLVVLVAQVRGGRRWC